MSENTLENLNSKILYLNQMMQDNQKDIFLLELKLKYYADTLKKNNIKDDVLESIINQREREILKNADHLNFWANLQRDIKQENN